MAAQIPSNNNLNAADSYLSASFMHAGSSPITPKLEFQLSIPIPTRDPDYYISDGNTVLLVENTLFKVCILNIGSEK